MREPCRIAANHAQSGAAIATGDELFDPTVVEATARRSPILDEHLGEVAAAAQRAIESRLQHAFVDQIAHAPRRFFRAVR